MRQNEMKKREEEIALTRQWQREIRVLEQQRYEATLQCKTLDEQQRVSEPFDFKIRVLFMRFW